ncbi:MAG: murein biosynthesis integral membrane protein MurJ [Bosea sp.]|jgi:putative peptidoglycan lipid II flippase|nr:murein biosynthesis integral membrane protein MurJ [Bosea sp. (in: a-proteobacteria)]
MFKKILSVGGFTLLSRLTGFVRDIMLAAVLGASAMMDAFVIAQRLPNQFRAIFGEGAFSSAFIPSYARLREQAGVAAAQLFADRVFTLILLVQLGILALALPFMPWIVAAIAPGQRANPDQLALTVALARIAFPYLLFITLVTLQAGLLNAVDKFAAAAFAPVLLNVSVVAAMAVAFLFPSAAHAAAWGVAIAGVAEWALLTLVARRAGVMATLTRPAVDGDVKQFLTALGPAVLGSAGVQIAVLADTILASFLPSGSYAAIYYADRIYQLPVGVIGIAAGTVVLPTMSRLIAAGQEGAAHHEQNRAIGMTLILSLPFVAAFLTMPDLLVRALFGRGAFDAAAADGAAVVLLAYAVGLTPVLLIRSVVASFFARGDTATPVIASLTALGVNVALKIVLSGEMGAAGLALSTSIGAWVNLGILYALAARRGWTTPDNTLVKAAIIAFAGAIAFELCVLTARPLAEQAASLLPREQALAAAILLGAPAMLAYGAAAWALARQLRFDLRLPGRRGRTPREAGSGASEPSQGL